MSKPEERTIAIDESREFQLPVVELLTGRSFVTGKSGSGKSNTAGVIIEELLDGGFPVMIVDTDGEYWGLKEQYEILHVGDDEECDLQVGPEHADKLAELALEENVPIILDVSGYLYQETADELIRKTAKALFDREKRLQQPFLLLVEEAHEYIPQQGSPGPTGEMLITIGKRGRKRGLGLMGVSQRPQDVQKQFISQCDLIIWHRLTWDTETEVVRRVIDSETAEAVQELADGEAFVMADFLDSDLSRVQIRRKQTFDAGDRPDLEQVEMPELKSVGDELVGELEQITEEQEKREDRISQLEAELEARDNRIAELEEEVEQARDMRDMAEQFSDALTQSAGSEDADAIQERVDEIREEKNTRIRELESTVQELKEERDELQSALSDAEARVEELEQHAQVIEHMDELEEAVTRMNSALGLGGDGQAEELREELREKREQITDLEARIESLRSEGHAIEEEFEEAIDFVRDEAVQDEIERVNDKLQTSDKHTWDVITYLIEEGSGSASEMQTYLDIGRSPTSSILSRLEEHNITAKERQGQKAVYSLNTTGMEDIIEQRRKREELDDLRESVQGTS